MTKQVNKQQQLTKIKPTKKCRGNRKLQRFKRNCRKKGMNNQAIEMLMEIQEANRLIHQDSQQIIYGEKIVDDSLTMNTQSHISNRSILSESQDHSHKHQLMKENLLVDLTSQSSISLPPSIGTSEWAVSSVPTTTTTHQKRLKRYNLSTDHWKQTSKLIPNYNQLSPYQFKDLLVKIISPTDQYKIKQWLTNFTIVQFIQQRAQLICNVSQLKIEQDYWNYIANLTTMPIMIWLLEISKDVTKQNSINWDHTKTKMNIKHRQQIIKNNLKQAENKLNIHLQQPYPFYWQMENKIATNNHPINIISNALIILIQNSLYYFQTTFEQKKILLKFDMNDAHLVKSLYDLNPAKEEICTIQKIWRTKVKSSKRAILQKKKNHSSMKMMMMMKNQITATKTIKQDQQNELLAIESFRPSMRTIIEARLTNIEQRAQQLMQFSNTITDKNFF